MTHETAPPLPVDHDAGLESPPEAALVPQPAGLSLPIRVPLVAECGGRPFRAEVIGSTTGVLLLQASERAVATLALGTPIRLRLDWDRQMLNGRIAAHGATGRLLVSIGERAIRRSRRSAVDLAGSLSSAHMPGPVEVRVRDLSASGARVAGIQLPVGSDVSLRFTPPNRPAPLTVLGFVVRGIAGGDEPAVGIAFRLVQSSMDVLKNP